MQKQLNKEPIPPACGRHNVEVLGASVHNLKHINITFPHNKLTVITGVSGSGKSSLAFDTIYAEGQRRYRESFNVYARHFLDTITRPEVDKINGLSPVIAIEQKTTSRNPRSTVGTATEIYDFMRLLFARTATAYSYLTGNKMEQQSAAQIQTYILKSFQGQYITLLAPIVKSRKGHYQERLQKISDLGFSKIRINGVIQTLSLDRPLIRYQKNDVEIVIDHFCVDPKEKHRIELSVHTALHYGGGAALLQDSKGTIHYFSKSLMDPMTGLTYEDPEPNTFSFNSPSGACPTCSGLGEILQVDAKVSKRSLDETSRYTLLCIDCQGARLKKSSLCFTLYGKNITDMAMMNLEQLYNWFEELMPILNYKQQQIAYELIQNIQKRIKFLLDIGLSYLHLNRPLVTLSGGESQRIRLATQIGTQLIGVLYILDEPSIGLHQRDNCQLIGALKLLRDLGNTLLVVEHDEEMMLAADYLIEIGPGAGIYGGSVIAVGTPDQFLQQESVTKNFLMGVQGFSIPKQRNKGNGKKLVIKGCSGNNLQNVTLTIPLGTMVCITGVSGSGKSTLIHKTLLPILKGSLGKSPIISLPYQSVTGIEYVNKVIAINQESIGKTSRSNPSTYIGIFSDIRNLFALLPEAKMRGYKASRFSFNLQGGRCASCEGNGLQRVGIDFLFEAYLTCDVCKGKRYNRETLEVTYKGKSIAEVLEMTIDDAVLFFENHPHIVQKLSMLTKIGCGYITLGQHATTLSGGEAQRIKLAAELTKKGTGNTMYILDEPTTGLHFQDIEYLIRVLEILVQQGNTVLIIEHNMDVIKLADYVIDVGPEGGTKGGMIIAAGTPEEVAQHPTSYTAQFLKQKLTKLK